LLLNEPITDQTPLLAGTSYTVSRQVTLPANSAGHRYLLFITDVNNDQGEVNEANNLRAVAIDVLAPDLAVTDSTSPADAVLDHHQPGDVPCQRHLARQGLSVERRRGGRFRHVAGGRGRGGPLAARRGQQLRRFADAHPDGVADRRPVPDLRHRRERQPGRD